jgi:putative transposase
MPEKDAPVHEAIKVVIGTTRRGRKKVIAMVQRVHPYFSSSKIRRVYEKGGFALYVKPTRKRAKTLANPAYIPMKENMEWGIDFMHDSLESGRQIRAFNIIDPFNRVCKGMFINHSMPASRVIDLLQRAIDVHGKPAAIRSDNGPEFISKKFQLWLKDHHIKWEQIKKASPQENCFIERFNRTAREDLFSANIFLSPEDAQKKADEFKDDYNNNRPHESLQNKTPLEYAA